MPLLIVDDWSLRHTKWDLFELPIFENFLNQQGNRRR